MILKAIIHLFKALSKHIDSSILIVKHINLIYSTLLVSIKPLSSSIAW